MKTIYTRKGEPFIVDEDDYQWLSALTWRVDKDGYAVTSTPKCRPIGVPSMLFMHRMVMGICPGDPRFVDHRFGIKNDNRKSELRVCTNQQNLFNSKRRSHNKSGFKGVVRVVGRGLPWRASIVINKKARYLGLFETPELAHEFYCLAADMAYGEFANHGTSVRTAPTQQELAVIAPLVKAALGEK